MKILVTGGCGYKGSVLIPELLKDGFEVINVDNQWFGNFLRPHPNLINLEKDIRELESSDFAGVSSVIHLANIANDPAVDLNPILSWEVNVLGSQLIADLAKEANVKHIIYASSGSVYGIKEEEKVTEDLKLIPISVYNKTKMVAERIFYSYGKDMRVHCIRPATVCVYSPRMRLDVSVNMLTFQALKNKEIKVFGGNQTRPNIHIKDMVNVYKHFLNQPSLPNGFYNAGFENISILELAKKISRKVPCEITIQESNDPRSYRQDSSKLLSTGFIRKYSIDDAIDEIIDKFKGNKIEDKDEFYTVKWMKKLGINK